jgi:uncharacterized protein (TIGR02996 family)
MGLMLDTATDNAFLRTILAYPDDDAPRLVYADWLDERGDAERAEFIRLQVRLHRMPVGDTDRPALEARIADLQQPHFQKWVDELPNLPGVHWEMPERGFISTARFETPDAFFEFAPDVFAAAPIQEVWLHRFTFIEAGRLARSRYLNKVRVLDFNDGNRIGNHGVEALMKSPYVANLTELKLARNSLGSAGVRAIAEATHLRRLEVLILDHNDLFDDGLRYLVQSPNMSGLLHLDLERTRTGNDAVRALAKSPHLTGLRKLHLSGNLLTDEGLAALCRSNVLADVRDLFLHSNSIADRGVEALADSPQFGRLQRLHLRQNQVGDAGAEALADSRYLDEMRELYVGGNRISDVGAERLRTRFRGGVNVW